MPALEPLCHLIGINHTKFSKQENILIEADLFLRVCEELKEIFKNQYKDYFRFIKVNSEKEDVMLENIFTKLIINDILATGEYSMQGIACYTDTHEDIIDELASGLNTKPSATCLRKIIELHRTVRKELYQSIGKKIASEYSSVA